MKDYTIKHLEEVLEGMIPSGTFPFSVITVETVGKWLCGMNWKLAEQPFSSEFLCNVAYDAPECMYGIIWLQLNYTK